MKKKYLIAAINMPILKNFGIAALIFSIGKVVSWLISVGINKFNWNGSFISFHNDAYSLGQFYSTIWTFVLGFLGLGFLYIAHWLICDFINEYKRELEKLDKLEEKGEAK